MKAETGEEGTLSSGIIIQRGLLQPAALKKKVTLINSVQSEFATACYEVGHPWTEHPAQLDSQ